MNFFRKVVKASLYILGGLATLGIALGIYIHFKFDVPPVQQGTNTIQITFSDTALELVV